MLEPLQRVEHQETRTLNSNMARVRRPVLLDARVDAAQAVDQPLDGPEDRIEKRSLALEDPGHVRAERLREREDDAEKQQDLNDAIRSHGNPQKRSGWRRT